MDLVKQNSTAVAKEEEGQERKGKSNMDVSAVISTESRNAANNAKSNEYDSTNLTCDSSPEADINGCNWDAIEGYKIKGKSKLTIGKCDPEDDVKRAKN